MSNPQPIIKNAVQRNVESRISANAVIEVAIFGTIIVGYGIHILHGLINMFVQ